MVYDRSKLRVVYFSYTRKSYSLHFVFGLLRGEGAGRRELAVAVY